MPALGDAAARRTPWDERASVQRGEDLLKSVMLQRHNAARKAYGSAPLAWNEALAARARNYAAVLARTRRFEHDPQTNVRPRDGENLFMGTRGAYSYGEMIDYWIDERADFRRGRFPEVSRSGHWTQVGHYTQMVWPATREVGCAVVANRNDEFLVCRYSPAGNVVGMRL